MAKFEWAGTVLIITDDNGTITSCDLKGATGDMGPRGPQGPCGVIYGPDGTVDLTDYVTMDKLIEVLGAIGVAEEGEY